MHSIINQVQVMTDDDDDDDDEVLRYAAEFRVGDRFKFALLTAMPLPAIDPLFIYVDGKRMQVTVTAISQPDVDMHKVRLFNLRIFAFLIHSGGVNTDQVRRVSSAKAAPRKSYAVVPLTCGGDVDTELVGSICSTIVMPVTDAATLMPDTLLIAKHSMVKYLLVGVS